VIELLKLEIGDRDERADVSAKVTDKLLGLDQAFESARPALLALRDLPVDGHVNP
jgi:hypothetical protein